MGQPFVFHSPVFVVMRQKIVPGGFGKVNGSGERAGRGDDVRAFVSQIDMLTIIGLSSISIRSSLNGP